MMRRAIATVTRHTNGGALHQLRRSSSRTSTPTVSSAVNSMIIRSLKDHYHEVSNMAPPPKVSPPAEFMIVKGALDSHGPVLRRQFNNEEISVSVMRLANIVEEDVDDNENDDDNDDDGVNQLFVHVDVSKPGKKESLSFLCGLYPDALGIHSVALRPKSDESFVFAPNQFTGPLFENLDEKTRDAFHNYIEARGINESLFPFLQAWLYVRDHRNLMRWFKSIGSFVAGQDTIKEIEKSPKGTSTGVKGPRVAKA